MQQKTSLNFHKEHPFLIAGPCSAETEDQVLETAKGLKNLNIDAFRAGVWKPRTRPGSFEGVGKIALPWLKKARNILQKPIVVEIANPNHLEEVLKAEIDMVWIGARTTVNPFAIQEIADALKGISIPVFVKNPVNPDLDLWIGAIERIERAGIKEIVAIHRGFSSFTQSIYRNEPQWEIPIELQRQMPNIPIICDPSHICGRRDILKETAQQALDLNFDGLMIESHPDPKNAWSDAAQQLKPQDLKFLLDELVVRKVNSDNAKFNFQLENIRANIDKIDTDLVNLFAKRLNLVKEIGAVKKANNITILQPERWAKIVAERINQAQNLDLKEDFILKLFQMIHQQSIRKQTEVFEN